MTKEDQNKKEAVAVYFVAFFTQEPILDEEHDPKGQ